MKNENYKKAVERLVHDQLQPGENLLRYDKKITRPLSVFVFIISAFCILYGIRYFVGANPFIGELFILGIGVLLLWYAFFQFTKGNKNHYFVTDKRLCIREARAFGKARNIDIPINEIEGVNFRKRRNRMRRSTRGSIFIVRTKDGKSIIFKSPDIRRLAEAIESQINCS